MKETKYWTWHVVAGGAILFLLGLHMLTMHLDKVMGILNPAGGEALDWENVIGRGRMAFMLVIYVLLLGAALYHGLYGLRNILFELTSNKGAQKFVNVFFVIIGLCLFAFGTYSAVMARITSLAS